MLDINTQFDKLRANMMALPGAHHILGQLEDLRAAVLQELTDLQQEVAAFNRGVGGWKPPQ